MRTYVQRSTRLHFCLVLLGLATTARAQPIDVSTDFSGGSLQSAALSGETLRLEGLPTWSLFPEHFRWFQFRADGVSGRQLQFQIGSAGNRFLGDLTNHRFVYSYDQQTWQFFDSNRFNGLRATFGNESPFTEDSVFVAYSTPYPIARTDAHVAEARAHWFVAPTTASDIRDLSVGSLQGLPLYGYSITNPLVEGPKKKFLLTAGNHSAEMGGNFALEGTLDFLLSDDPRAVAMRDVAEFFVYPQLDPLGRHEGYSRGNSQNPASDHNRFWNALATDNNGGFEEITTLATIMRADTGGDVDYSFDYHGFFDSGPDFIFADTAAARRPFLRELQRLEPELTLNLDNSTTPAGIFEIWARAESGLNAEFSYTPEFSPNRPISELIELGRSYALAMYQELEMPVRTPSGSEIDRLARELRTGAPGREFDLNKDLQVTIDDLEFFVVEVLNTYYGDTNLDGEFNSTDLVNVFRGGEYEDEIAANSTWITGDWNGDEDFTSSDLVLALRQGGFEQGPRALTGIAVPEPMHLSLRGAFFCVAFVWSTRKRSITLRAGH